MDADEGACVVPKNIWADIMPLISFVRSSLERRFVMTSCMSADVSMDHAEVLRRAQSFPPD